MAIDLSNQVSKHLTQKYHDFYTKAWMSCVFYVGFHLSLELANENREHIDLDECYLSPLRIQWKLYPFNSYYNRVKIKSTHNIMPYGIQSKITIWFDWTPTVQFFACVIHFWPRRDILQGLKEVFYYLNNYVKFYNIIGRKGILVPHFLHFCFTYSTFIFLFNGKCKTPWSIINKNKEIRAKCTTFH